MKIYIRDFDKIINKQPLEELPLDSTISFEWDDGKRLDFTINENFVNVQKIDNRTSIIEVRPVVSNQIIIS